jgi:hypothetical protein
MVINKFVSDLLEKSNALLDFVSTSSYQSTILVHRANSALVLPLMLGSTDVIYYYGYNGTESFWGGDFDEYVSWFIHASNFFDDNWKNTLHPSSFLDGVYPGINFDSDKLIRRIPDNPIEVLESWKGYIKYTFVDNIFEVESDSLKFGIITFNGRPISIKIEDKTATEIIDSLFPTNLARQEKLKYLTHEL